MYCNKKWKWAHGRISRCFGYHHVEADPDRSELRKTSGYGKCALSLHFGSIERLACRAISASAKFSCSAFVKKHVTEICQKIIVK